MEYPGKGDEIITLTHLLPGVPRQRIALPGYRALFRYRFEAQDDVLGEMALDTVFLDLEAPGPKRWRVELTWRARTPTATGSTTTEALLMVPGGHTAKPKPSPAASRATRTQEARHG